MSVGRRRGIGKWRKRRRLERKEVVIVLVTMTTRADEASNLMRGIQMDRD